MSNPNIGAVHLLNGATQERLRASEGTVVQPCGCAYTASTWLQMCDVHYQPWHQRHEQSRYDHALVVAARRP